MPGSRTTSVFRLPDFCPEDGRLPSSVFHTEDGRRKTSSAFPEDGSRKTSGLAWLAGLDGLPGLLIGLLACCAAAWAVLQMPRPRTKKQCFKKALDLPAQSKCRVPGPLPSSVFRTSARKTEDFPLPSSIRKTDVGRRLLHFRKTEVGRHPSSVFQKTEDVFQHSVFRKTSSDFPPLSRPPARPPSFPPPSRLPAPPSRRPSRSPSRRPARALAR